jgi:hypothetical protein
VQRAAESNQRGHVGSPAAKHYGYVSLINMDRYAPEHSVVLVRGHLGHALHPGIHMRGSIARMSLIKGGPIAER